MKKIFIITIILSSLLATSSCRKMVRAGIKAAKEKGRESGNSSSSRSSKNYTEVSEAELKKMAKTAKAKLSKYKVDCQNYKRAFDTATTYEHYNKAAAGFKSTYSSFRNWYNGQNFHKLKAKSSKFDSQYRNWLTKFDSYYNKYTSEVKASQSHRATELSKRPRVVYRRTT